MPLGAIEKRLERIEVAVGEKARTAAQVPVFLDPAFPHQTSFVADPAKLKAALCTRRAGKSYGAGSYLLKEAWENPGCTCLYIALTRQSAKNILWKDVLKTINRKLALGCKFNETELSCTLPNGSVIYLLGVDATEEEREKLLGQKYRLVVIDEAASYTINLEELVYGTLKPAVADYRGTICLIGTPGNLKRGLFFDITNGKRAGWSLHRWSAFENPHIRDNWLAEIAELKAASPLIEETPLFQQHYLGRWVVDDSKLVYRYQPGRNDFANLPELPPSGWHYLLGIDLGYTDATAFVVGAYHDQSRVLYLVEALEETGLDISAVAARIKDYQARYPLDTLVVDGANKQAVEEMRRRHGLPLEAADKRGKADFIEQMNAEFIQGRIVLGPSCVWNRQSQPGAPGSLQEEYLGLIWDERALARGERKEHPNAPNHGADASLYLWKRAYQYLSEVPAKKHAPGTREAAEAEAAELKRLVLAQAEKARQEREEWELYS